MGKRKGGKPLTDEELQHRLELYITCGGNMKRFAEAMGTGTSAAQNTRRQFRERGMLAPDITFDGASEQERMEWGEERVALRDKIRELETTLAGVQRDNVTAKTVREYILGLAEQTPSPPSWLVKPLPKKSRSPGTPMAIWSDWHYGEVVDPEAVNGVNEFNMQIAERRVRTLVEKTIHLCFDHMVTPAYPGIVVNLLGDIFSGNIHEELRRTNEQPLGPVFLKVHELLIWAFSTLAEKFGKVFIPTAWGNHGRMDPHKSTKMQAHENFDWLLYNLLDRHFASDDRITFAISSSPDLLYRVHGHRFMATHGDSLGTRGGDGIIGALGPIMRGEVKVAKSSAQIGLDYDTLLMGHWHQLLRLPASRGIVNGSLKGYDEYAQVRMRATFEPPKQALWFQSPEHGIALEAHIYVDDQNVTRQEREWISVMAA